MIEIWADGSCSPNPGKMGIGIVFRYKGKQKEISRLMGEGTNQIAELTAIKVALLEIKDKTIPTTVYSDSQYSLNMISGEWNPKKNIELIDEIKSLLRMFKDIQIVWVRGHNGNKYNERADVLATTDLPEWRFR